MRRSEDAWIVPGYQTCQIPWLGNVPGVLARELFERGVRNVIIGDLSEEWYLYPIFHPIKYIQDIQWNLERYYPPNVVQRND